MRVVLDTNTLVSALLFSGATNFLVELWQRRQIKPLASTQTLSEFNKVLRYPKFKLSAAQITTVIAAYQPYVLMIGIDKTQLPENLPQCRDINDQLFILKFLRN